MRAGHLHLAGKWHFGDAGRSERDWRCGNAQGDCPSAVGRLGSRNAGVTAGLACASTLQQKRAPCLRPRKFGIARGRSTYSPMGAGVSALAKRSRNARETRTRQPLTLTPRATPRALVSQRARERAYVTLGLAKCVHVGPAVRNELARKARQP